MLFAAAGDPDVADRLKQGTELNGKSYKLHLDGHNQLDYFTGKTDTSPRKHFFYVSDDGDLTALRFDNWKIVFLEQRSPGTLNVWAEPYTVLRVPKIFNLRTDPFERGHHLEDVLRLATGSRVGAGSGAGVRRPDAADAQGVPVEPGTGELQHQRHDGEAEERPRQLVTRIV